MYQKIRLTKITENDLLSARSSERTTKVASLKTSFRCQKKAEESFFPIQLQGVVRYVSPVEVLATGIKWNQAISTLFGTDQGIKMNSEQLISSEQCTFSDTNEAWLVFSFI